MATTEGYNGAYTGQQIDAAIGKINDAVTVPGGGTMQMGESLGEGPYTIEVTEDGEGGDLSAEQVGYSNTGSGLEATNVQGAIDELAGKGGGEYLPLTGGTMQGDITIPADKAMKHGGSAAQIKMMPNGNIRIEAPWLREQRRLRSVPPASTWSTTRRRCYRPLRAAWHLKQTWI